MPDNLLALAIPQHVRSIGIPHEAYPATVQECIYNRRYRPGVLRLTRAFRRSKPWRGTLAERKEKFRDFNAKLAAIYGIFEPRLVFSIDNENARTGNGSYDPVSNTITLYGRLSVVTYLHEFGHARGYGERKTCRFSINLFRRIFPHSFARCRQVRHLLLLPE